MPHRLLLTASAVLVLLVAAPVLAGDRIYHLAVGDPARKNREAPLVLDAITDTATGEQVTPAEMVKRLSSTRLLLLGEEHTSAEFHAVQLRVIRALLESGRRVLIGLEMYPYTEQRVLDEWRDGLLTEDGFVRLSRWYDNWGYNWQYYRDIFLLARDHRVTIVAANTPREVVAAVRRKGLANLTPEEAAHVPARIDVDNADHLAFFKATFAEEQGPVHNAGASDVMWKNMLSAQCTWDATMGYNAVRALQQASEPDAIMVVLVGSGHVAYGLGIERQARTWFDGRISSLIPVPVTASGTATESVRASYANFIWGVPEEIDSAYPTLGTSTAVGQGETARKVLMVQKDSPAARAGIQAGDVLVAFDGTPLTDKETLNRLLAAKRWGDAAAIDVQRGDRRLALTVVFRRTLPAPSNRR
jgi:uncharacterized iron-regulated protein